MIDQGDEASGGDVIGMAPASGRTQRFQPGGNAALAARHCQKDKLGLGGESHILSIAIIRAHTPKRRPQPASSGNGTLEKRLRCLTGPLLCPAAGEQDAGQPQRFTPNQGPQAQPIHRRRSQILQPMAPAPLRGAIQCLPDLIGLGQASDHQFAIQPRACTKTEIGLRRHRLCHLPQPFAVLRPEGGIRQRDIGQAAGHGHQLRALSEHRHRLEACRTQRPGQALGGLDHQMPAGREQWHQQAIAGFGADHFGRRGC